MVTGTQVEARELSLFTINTGELYRGQAQPIIRALARKMAAGTYDSALALKAWRNLADSGARAYSREFKCGPGFGCFNVAARNMAAAELADHYAEELHTVAELVKLDAANRKRWTLAEVKHANESAGFYYFSRDTMRFFKDTMRCFAVRCEGGKIYVERIAANHHGLELGSRKEFNPETGSIA